MQQVIPPKPTPQPKPITQSGKILRQLKEAGSRGVANHKLATFNLGYRARITELRQDGHNIVAERQFIRGRATGVWKYYLDGE